MKWGQGMSLDFTSAVTTVTLTTITKLDAGTITIWTSHRITFFQIN
ncbi:hypothetical protein [Lentilactobacillus buchneri]|nr:hypothetical protein [Lentilactobacillus buchneri]